VGPKHNELLCGAPARHRFQTTDFFQPRIWTSRRDAATENNQANDFESFARDRSMSRVQAHEPARKFRPTRSIECQEAVPAADSATAARIPAAAVHRHYRVLDLDSTAPSVELRYGGGRRTGPWKDLSIGAADLPMGRKMGFRRNAPSSLALGSLSGSSLFLKAGRLDALRTAALQRRHGTLAPVRVSIRLRHLLTCDASGTPWTCMFVPVTLSPRCRR